MRNITFLIIGFVVCCGLFASTTFNQSVFHHYILDTKLEHAYTGLWQAAKRGDSQALLTLAEQAQSDENEYWLNRAASLNSLTAQLALARLHGSSPAHYDWLEKAAKNGHAASQFELHLVENDPDRRIELLSSAANSDYQPAIISLAKYLYEAGILDEASVWLKKAAQFDQKSRYKLGRVQWMQNKRKEALASFQQSGQDLAIAKRYADTIAKNKQVKMSSLFIPESKLQQNCSQQLQFVAISLDSAVQAMQFAKKFESDPRFDDFPICLNPLLWLQQNELKCELSNNRQQCDLSPIASHIHKPNYTHLVLFLGAGTAYVQNGVMHLDQADTYSVFIHELAHFAGFVDEYAVSSELASAYCRVGQAPNLMLKPNDDVSIYQSPKFEQWQQYAQIEPVEQSQMSASTAFNSDDDAVVVVNSELNSDYQTTNSLQIARSRTCLRLNIETYKPSSDITFLEHHDTKHIPDIYLKMWREALTQNHQEFAVAEAFYNSAFDFESSDAVIYWASYLE